MRVEIWWKSRLEVDAGYAPEEVECDAAYVRDGVLVMSWPGRQRCIPVANIGGECTIYREDLT